MENLAIIANPTNHEAITAARGLPCAGPRRPLQPGRDFPANSNSSNGNRDGSELCEAVLLDGLQRGIPCAQAALFDAFEPAVRRLLTRLLKQPTDVADALQDTFLRCFRCVAQVKEPSTLRGWIMQVARSIALDQLRRLHRQRKHAALNHEAIDVPVHDASFELRVALHRTRSVLGRLPRNERDIFAMRQIDGLELGTLATLCGVSLATIKRRLTRAEGRFYALARREPALADWLSA